MSDIGELDYSALPEVICDDHPEWIALYREAWKEAFAHICEVPALPHPRYMSEGTEIPHLWIWDSCFMSLFCKYAPGTFPGLDTIDNLYQVLYDNATPGVYPIHHVDNPPLFAWVEWENFLFNGDIARIRRIVGEKRYLQRHYAYFETTRVGTRHANGFLLDSLQRNECGYFWSGIASGMDNTPRGWDCYANLYWVDAVAQQALAALCISRLAEAAGLAADAAEFRAHYQEKCACLQAYWDEQDGCYYDLNAATHDACRVLTPASFWPLLAEAATPEQAARQCGVLNDPQLLGGEMPLPSVARNSIFYNPQGAYWRGGIWLPTTYMTIKALEKYGRHALGAELAERTLDRMARVFNEFEPHTIWECYAPEAPLPGTQKTGKYCRRNFCGWSALGPISLLIENLIGVNRADAAGRLEIRRPQSAGRRGVRNLRFGAFCIDAMLDGNTVEITSNAPLRLTIDGKEYPCPAGRNFFTVV